MNLLTPEHAYIFGFIQTDGHIYEGTRNRSKITIEISDRDEDIINNIHKILPIKSTVFRRNRITNFGPCSLIGLRICNRTFTDELKLLGIPSGKKSKLIAAPTVAYSEIDYWRGIVDGDGSVGVDKNGIPFFGFVSDSEKLIYQLSDYIFKIVGYHYTPCKNKRDNIFTLTIARENAQKIISNLYYNNCLALNRKIKMAEIAMTWERPSTMKRRKTL